MRIIDDQWIFTNPPTMFECLQPPNPLHPICSHGGNACRHGKNMHVEEYVCETCILIDLNIFLLQINSLMLVQKGTTLFRKK